MKQQPQPRYPVFVALKLTTAQAQAVRRAACADDRTVSSYLRRLIAAAVGVEDRQEEQHG